MKIEIKGSLDNKYRYWLQGIWEPDRPICTFIMLNPAIADGSGAITKCQRFAEKFGHGSVVVVNLFGARALRPRYLLEMNDPLGDMNQDYIEQAMLLSKGTRGKIICGWGNPIPGINLVPSIVYFAYTNRIKLMCLGKTKFGNPVHPLHISYDRNLIPLEGI